MRSRALALDATAICSEALKPDATYREECRDARLLVEPQGRRWVRTQGLPRSIQRGIVEASVCPFDRDILPQLFHGVRVPVKRELPRAFHGEDPARDNRGERRIGGRMTPSRILGVEVSGAGVETDFDMRRFNRGVYIDKAAVWPQEAPRTEQGIDHALRRQSSQGPRQQDHIETLVRNDQMFEPDGACLHRSGRRVGAEGCDGRLIGVNRQNRRGALGVPAGQATVAAADFENLTVHKRWDQRRERGDFVAFGIESDRHSCPARSLCP